MLEIKDGKLFKDGKEHHIRSGAVHYFRTLPEYWLDRLQKLKAAGLNTVETYTCWNLHEPQKGKFDFEGRLDICRFVETAASLGLDVILRPGPYICAEWDLGGLPAWLLKDGTIRLRCNDPVFVAHERDYLKELFARVGKYLACNGGNIVAVQIENEYGSFANDKDYLKAVEGIFDECGVNVLRFTSDGPCGWMLSGGTLPGVWKTLNFGSGGSHAFGSLDRFREKAPKMCMEFWCGWFDHWGFVHHRQNIKLVGEISPADRHELRLRRAADRVGRLHAQLPRGAQDDLRPLEADPASAAAAPDAAKRRHRAIDREGIALGQPRRAGHRPPQPHARTDGALRTKLGDDPLFGRRRGQV